MFGVVVRRVNRRFQTEYGSQFPSVVPLLLEVPGGETDRLARIHADRAVLRLERRRSGNWVEHSLCLSCMGYLRLTLGVFGLGPSSSKHESNYRESRRKQMAQVAVVDYSHGA